MGAINQEKEKFWLAKLAEAKERGGSLDGFCREQGLSSSTFSYWRKRFRAQESKAVVPATAKFIPVEISSVACAPLPDPRWLAELIGHLMGTDR